MKKFIGFLMTSLLVVSLLVPEVSVAQYGSEEPPSNGNQQQGQQTQSSGEKTDDGSSGFSYQGISLGVDFDLRRGAGPQVDVVLSNGSDRHVVTAGLSYNYPLTNGKTFQSAGVHVGYSPRKLFEIDLVCLLYFKGNTALGYSLPTGNAFSGGGIVKVAVYPEFKFKIPIPFNSGGTFQNEIFFGITPAFGPFWYKLEGKNSWSRPYQHWSGEIGYRYRFGK